MYVVLYVLISLSLIVKRRGQKNMESKMLILITHRYIYRTIFLNILYGYECTNTTIVNLGEMTGI